MAPFGGHDRIMRIVATTDGSLRSLAVLPHAAAFANASRSELVLLRVLDPQRDVPRSKGVPAQKRVKSRVSVWTDELRATLDAFSIAGEPTVDVMRRGERVHDAIARVADKAGARMIALSSRGAGAIRHALIGSVAARLIGSSGLPILTAGPHVGRTRQARQYKIRATTDGSTASRDVLDAIGTYVERSSMKLFLFRAYVPTLGDRGERAEMADCRKRIRKLQEEFWPHATRSMVSHLEGLARLDDAILQAAEKITAHAIAMSTYGHSAGRHLLVGSTAPGVLTRSHSPLILARAEPLPDDEPAPTGSSDSG